MRHYQKIAAMVAASAIALSPITASAQPQGSADVNYTHSQSNREVLAQPAAGQLPSNTPIVIDAETASQLDPWVNSLIDHLQRLYGGIYPWMIGIIPGLPTDLPLDQFRPVSDPVTSTSSPTVVSTPTSSPPTWTRPIGSTTPPSYTRPTGSVTVPTYSPTTSTPTPTSTSTTTPQPTGCPAGDRTTLPNPDSLTREIHEAVNVYRVNNGLRPLIRNTALEEVAFSWSSRLASGIPAMHNPNLGEQVPSCHRGYAENISGTTGVMTAEKVVTGWKNSPSHNAIMLNPDLTDMGIGVAKGWLWDYATANFAIF